MNRQDAFKLAIANIAAFSDTDVFPSPLDRLACQDAPDLVLKMLEEVDRTFDQYLASLPPENIDTLAPLGYTAFRWATQIDPVWNAYFLSLVLMIAETIEAKRLPVGAQNVFSYRFAPDLNTGHLFGDSTWRHYKQNALQRSHEHPFVLLADVADFYPRVAHHRLENELIRLGIAGDEPRRIKTLMAQFLSDSFLWSTGWRPGLSHLGGASAESRRSLPQPKRNIVLPLCRRFPHFRGI